MISHNTEETQKIATDFITQISHRGEASVKTKATVVGLYGNLGAGKTAFTQCVARSLGVVEKVLSPTFVIMKVYEMENQAFKHLIHIDAYRMDSSDELTHLGWQEMISNPYNLILIEWPERVADIMPNHIKITIQTLENENFREIILSTYSA